MWSAPLHRRSFGLARILHARAPRTPPALAQRRRPALGRRPLQSHAPLTRCHAAARGAPLQPDSAGGRRRGEYRLHARTSAPRCFRPPCAARRGTTSGRLDVQARLPHWPRCERARIPAALQRWHGEATFERGLHTQKATSESQQHDGTAGDGLQESSYYLCSPSEHDRQRHQGPTDEARPWHAIQARRTESFDRRTNNAVAVRSESTRGRVLSPLKIPTASSGDCYFNANPSQSGRRRAACAGAGWAWPREPRKHAGEPGIATPSTPLRPGHLGAERVGVGHLVRLFSPERASLPR